MPLVRIETNQRLSAPKSRELCERLSRLTAEVLRKPEHYVQVILHQNTDDHVHVLHGGSGQAGHAAFVDVRSIGGLGPQVNRTLAGRICALLTEVADVPGERVYLNFTDVPGASWGHDGSTFG